MVGYGQKDHSSGLYSHLPPTFSFVNGAAICSADRKIWHRRLAHVNEKDLANIYKHADGVPKFDTSNVNCRTCRLSKAHKLPFKEKFKASNISRGSNSSRHCWSSRGFFS